MLGKRSRDLEATIVEMLVGDGTHALPPRFADTSVYQSAQAAVERSYLLTWNWIKRKPKKEWSKARPGHLPAAAFAVAVVEMLTTVDIGTVLREHDGLAKRLTTLVREGPQDVVDLKASLETWFDDTMARLQEAYKRRATTVLLVVGVAIALAGNVSVIGVAQSLWSDSVAREAVVAAAGNVRDQSAPLRHLPRATVAEVGQDHRHQRRP